VSLRRRVILGFVVVAAVLVVSNVVLTSTFRNFLVSRVDDQLQTAGGPLAGRRGGPGPDRAGDNNRALSEYFQADVDLTSGDIVTTGGYDPEQRPPPRLTIGDIEKHATAVGSKAAPFTTRAQSGDGKWRVVVFASQFDPSVIRVLAINLDSVNATLSQARTVQITGTLAALAALGLVSFWMIRLGVVPIAAMADTAEKISGGDLSHRVDHPDVATEAGRLGASLNSMLDRIEEAFRAREESEAKVRRFAADASHELRTPLTSIRGYAELYRAGALDDHAALADAMRRVESEAQRMGLLVEDLLQLARLDQKQVAERHDVDLADIASDAVSDARAVEPDRPIEIHAQSAVVHGDEAALRQVVANLLTNVRAHTPAGTPARIAVSSHDGTAELRVSDDGPGMPDEVAAHVFERFYRADKVRTRSEGGTGLGLAIVDSIVRAHGGSVTVSSAEGEGAEFVISLPLAWANGSSATP
jgi:two-component system OmpR family sensor kinase